MDFWNVVVSYPDLGVGEISTAVLLDHFERGQNRTPPKQSTLDYMAIAALMVYHNLQSYVRESFGHMPPMVGGVPVPQFDPLQVQVG